MAKTVVVVVEAVTTVFVVAAVGRVGGCVTAQVGRVVVGQLIQWVGVKDTLCARVIARVVDRLE